MEVQPQGGGWTPSLLGPWGGSSCLSRGRLVSLGPVCASAVTPPPLVSLCPVSPRPSFEDTRRHLGPTPPIHKQGDMCRFRGQGPLPWGRRHRRDKASGPAPGSPHGGETPEEVASLPLPHERAWLTEALSSVPSRPSHRRKTLPRHKADTLSCLTPGRQVACGGGERPPAVTSA